MPIYPYICVVCEYTENILSEIGGRNKTQFCPSCGSLMRRAIELQNVAVRGDIEPGYDQSLGEYVGSRKELREKLAFNDAYCPDLMQGSEPQAGRLTKEEKAISLGQDVRSKKTIFERRRELGWGASQADDDISTEGERDIKPIIDSIKARQASK